VPLAIVGVWLVRGHSDKTSQSRNRDIDLPGQSLAIFALADIAATTIEAGGDLGSTHPLIMSGFGAFVAMAAGFIFVESKSPAPIDSGGQIYLRAVVLKISTSGGKTIQCRADRVQAWTSGLIQFGSSNVPTAIPRVPGRTSPIQVTVEPHVGQNSIFAQRLLSSERYS
jgi:hypothetical protein